MTFASNILDSIGNTPLQELRNIDTGPCRLFAKLEYHNPGGSIKDRIALSMVQTAERDGLIQPGGTLIEATAGNTGLGLALVAAQKGYKLLIVIPDKMSQEKVFHLQAMGAEVLMTRSDVVKGHPEYYQDYAARIAQETPNAFYVNQFANPANVQAHVEGTGPEIWQQMEHNIDAFVCGVGTGGTLTGVGSYLKKMSEKTQVILADPEGSVLADYVNEGVMREAGSWQVEGIGEDFIPDICDLSLVDRAYSISDQLSFATGRELLAREGIFVGSSSGTILAAALHYCRSQTECKRVVAIIPDSGNKYISKMYNDHWMLDQGFIERKHYGDLRDLISRLHRKHETVVATPDETLIAAQTRMKMHDISQLPVLQDDHICGIIDESDILLAVNDHPEHFRDPVSKYMTKKLDVVVHTAPIKQLLQTFAKDHVAIVMHGDEFLGIITRSDLLNYLRRKIS